MFLLRRGAPAALLLCILLPVFGIIRAQAQREGLCGDGLCTGEENFTNCPEDCRASRRLLKRLRERDVCDDGVCGYRETCKSCPEDCGSCATEERAAVLPFGITGEEERPAVTVGDVGEALLHLDRLMELDASFAGRISDRARRRIGKLKEAELIARDVRRPVTFWQGRTLGKATADIGQAIRTEAEEVRNIVGKDMFGNPLVREITAALPQGEEVAAAAAEGDLGRLLELLPDPPEDVGRLLSELRDIEEGFSDVLGEETTLEGAVSLILRALAEDVAPGEEETLDPKERFKKSAFLLKRMREMAIDPDANLPSLEERLSYLMDRRNALSGVVGIAEDELQDDISETQGVLKDPSAKTLIRLSGILRYIRTTANFERFETMLIRSASRMRTGVSSILKLFVWRVSPRAEAAAMLKEHARALESGDPARQKKALGDVLQIQEDALQALLEQLPDNEEETFRRRFAKLRSALGNARTPTEIRREVERLEVLVHEMQGAARSRKNIVLRLGYAVQDFLGIGS